MILLLLELWNTQPADWPVVREDVHADMLDLTRKRAQATFHHVMKHRIWSIQAGLVLAYSVT
jgi:hypothetical protein